MRCFALTAMLMVVVALPALAQPEVVAVYAAPADLERGGVAGAELHYQVRTAGLDGVREGSILIAYRRVPAARGDAPFRYEPVWLESGRLQVLGVGPRWMTARQISHSPYPPLPSVDADGLPLDRVCIGDRVLESGQIGLTDAQVVGRFDLDLLFSGGGDEIGAGGLDSLMVWLSRFGVLGEVHVDVSIPGPQPNGTGEPPTTEERVRPVPLHGDRGWAEVRRVEESLALAQRRTRRLGDVVETALGLETGLVLATVSWVGEGVTEPGTATIRLRRATVVPNLRPGEWEKTAARQDGLGVAP